MRRHTDKSCKRHFTALEWSGHRNKGEPDHAESGTNDRLLALTSTAAAFDLGNQQPAKPLDSSVYQPPAEPPRQGGDTIENAIPITPTADIQVDLGLCHSSYDTKLYIYDATLNLIGCNSPEFGNPFQQITEPDFAVTIDPRPAALEAPWELIPPWGAVINGSGYHTLGTDEGIYTMTWHDVPGWITPDPETELYDVGDFQSDYLFTATYLLELPYATAISAST